MKADRTALIVGAGIGGLAAGVALRRAGWDVRVYERARSARELGFGLLLAPNALAALRELGVASSLTGPAQQTGNVEVRCLDGRLIRRLHNPLGGRAVVALRKELHEALLTAVGEDSLRFSSEAASFSQASERVTLTLADGRQVAGAILVGADGMRSAIRRQLHPDELPPAPSGFSAIRGLAYDALPALGSLSGVAYLDDGIEAAAMRAGTDAIYWYVSLLSAEIAEPYARAFVTKLLPTFDRAFRAIVEATASEDMRFDELSMREPLDSWGMGRVTLLGDAAHPVLPHTGQGAAQALEDAVAIGLSLRGPGDPAASLRRYEHVRARRTRSFVRLGPRIARATTTHNGAIRLARSIALRILPEFLLAKPMAALARDPHTRLRE